MKINNNVISIVAFAGLMSMVKAGADTWGVLAPGIPERVSVADEAVNVSFYILKQTHEPVFRREDGDTYSSRILEKWSRSLDYRRFEFCPFPRLEFAPGVPFSYQDFAAHISSFTAGYAPRFNLLRDGRCVKVSFESPQKEYLYFWTLYKYAPTRAVAGLTEAGLGAFFVKSVSPESIELSRKDPGIGVYNSVVLYAYKGDNDPRLNSREIKDFNLINATAIPGWVKEGFLRFDNPEMKAMVLIINHPDPKMRARVYNCVDIPKLRAAFFPGKKDFYDIATVLPMGVPGALPGLPSQDCGKADLAAGRLRFANWMFANREAMGNFAAEFKARSGLALQIEQYDISEFSKAFYRRPKPFDLAIIQIYVAPSPKDFFSIFFENGETYDFDIRPLSGRYRKLTSATEGAVRESFRELALDVSSHALALPISQNKRTLYFPREIKNLKVGRGILEYPEVADFRR